jgi:hypothetical protein
MSSQVGFSSSVGEGSTHATGNYNRRPGARGPAGPGSPNFTGYFKPPGTQSGPSNVSALAAAMGAMTIGRGGRRKNKTNKNKNNNKNKKNKNKSRKN